MSEPDLEELGIETNVPNITITEIPLEGEGHDKAYITENGFKFRVRVRQTDGRIERSPNELITDQILNHSFSLTITLAELNEDNSIKLIEGKYVIYEPHEILIDDEQLCNQSFNLDQVILEAIDAQAKRVEQIAAQKAQVVSHLKDNWGITLS